MTTTLYIICGILLLWLIGVDVRYYQVNKKLKIMHNTDKNLYELIAACRKLKDEKEKEDKPEVKRNNKKRVIKKSKRVRTPKSSS